jgi:hypothetical protein
MAEEYKEVIDNAGRTIKVAIETLGATIKEGMSAAMAETEKFAERDEKRNSTLDDIKSLMGQLNVLTTDVDSIKQTVQSSVQMLTQRQGTAPTDDTPRDKPALQEQFTTVRDAGMGSSPDMPATEALGEQMGIDMHNEPLEKWLKDGANVNVASMPQSIADAQVGDSMKDGVSPTPTTSVSIPDDGDDKKKGKLLTQAGSKAILGQVRNLAGGVLGLIAAVTGGVSIGRIFEGTIKEELDYDKLMGRIAKRTHALGDSTGILRDNFTDIGDRLALQLHSGHKIGEIMKAQVKAQQRGLKDHKKNEKFLESALVLSTLTDMSVESTTESFSNWSQYFNFTNMELANVGRTITQIARQTGLTGKNLEDAIKSAEKFNRSLRAAGTETAGMVGQTAKIMALAKAAGIEDVMGPLMEGLTGGFGKFKDLSSKMQSQLTRMAGGDTDLMMDIQVGRGLDPKNAKVIGQNFSDLVKKSIPGLDTLGPLEDLDISKIPSEQLRGMQAVAEEAFGMGLKDLQKQIGVFKDVAKDSADFIEDARKTEIKAILEINKLRDDGLITAAQEQAMIDAAHLQATNKINDINQVDRMKSLGVLKDLAKAGGPEWFRELGTMDKAATSGDFTASVDQAMETLKQGVADKTLKPEKFEKIMAQFGDPEEMKSAFSAALASGDEVQVAELIGRLNTLGETSAVVEAKGGSTQDKIEYHLDGMNAEIRDIISPNIKKILDFMGPHGVIMGGIAATIVAGLASLGILLTTIFPGKVAAMIGRTLKAPFTAISKIGGRGAASAAQIGPRLPHGGFTQADEAAKKLAKRNAAKAAGRRTTRVRVAKDSIGRGGKFVKQSFENVLGPPLKRAGEGLDTFGRAVATQGKALKIQAKRGALRASRSGVGQATGRLKTRIVSGASRVKGAADTTGRFVGRSFKNVGQGAKSGVMKIPGIKTAGKSIMTLGKQSTKVFGGLGRAGLGAARGLGATARSLSSWTIVVPLALAAVDGFIGTMRASSKAHEIFGVKQEEVTNSMRLASEGAAFWTGILDGLTFGLMSGVVGPTGTWTKALAKLFDKFKILSIIMQIIIVPLKVLWGVIVGLWKFLKHSFIGLWEGIKLAIEPLVELFDWMGGAIDQALTDIGLDEFFNSTSGLIDIVGMVAKPFEWLGKALGFVFKALGWVIGVLLKGLIPVFKVLWKVVSTIITSVLKPIVDVFKSLWEVGKTFIALFTGSGSLSDRFKDFGKAVMKFLLNFIMMIPKMVWNLVKGLGTLLYKGLVAGLTALFIYGPKIVSWIWDFISSGFEKVTSGAFWADVWDSLVIAAGNAIIWIEKAVSGFFSGVWEGASEWVSSMWQEVVDTFGEWVNVPVDFVKDMWTKIGNFFSEIPQFFSDMWTGIKEGFVAGVMWPINLVKDMWQGIKDWFSKLYHWLVGGSIIPDLVMDIINWFLKLPLKILKAVGGMVLSVIKFFVELPLKILKTLWKGAKAIFKFFIELPKKILKLLINGAKMWANWVIGLWDKVIDWIGFDWLTNAWTNFKNMLKDPFGFLSKAWEKFKNGLSMINPFNWDWESMWPDFLTKKFWTDMFSGISFTLPEWLKPSYWNDKLGDWTGFKFKWPAILTAQWWKDKFTAWKNFEFKWPEWLKPSYWNDKLGDWIGFKFKWPEFTLPEWLKPSYWNDKLGDWTGFKFKWPDILTAQWWKDKFTAWKNLEFKWPEWLKPSYWNDKLGDWIGFKFKWPEFTLPEWLKPSYWNDKLGDWTGFKFKWPAILTAQWWKDKFTAWKNFEFKWPEWLKLSYWNDKLGDWTGFKFKWPDILTAQWWKDNFKDLNDKFTAWKNFEFKWPEWLKPEWYAKKFKEWTGINVNLPEWMTAAYWGEKWNSFKMPNVFSLDWWVQTFNAIGTAIADTFVSAVDWVVNAIQSTFTRMIGAILSILGSISLPIPQFSTSLKPPFIDWEWEDVKLFDGAAKTGAKMTATADKMDTQETARQEINPLKTAAVASTLALENYRGTLDTDASQWSSDEFKKVTALLTKQQADKAALRGKITEAGATGGFTASRASTQERANEAAVNPIWFEKNMLAATSQVGLAKKVSEIEGYQVLIAKAFTDGVLTPEEKEMIKKAQEKVAITGKSFDDWVKKNKKWWGSEEAIRGHGAHDGIPKEMVDKMVKFMEKAKQARAGQDHHGERISGVMDANKILESTKLHVSGNKSGQRIKQLETGFYDHTPKEGMPGAGVNQSRVVDPAREQYLLANLEKMVVTLSARKDSVQMAGGNKAQLDIMQTMIEKAKGDVEAAREALKERKAAADALPAAADALPAAVGGAISPLLPEKGVLEKAAKDSTTPGSIYTHDIHLEKLLATISNAFWNFHTVRYARTHKVLAGIYETLKSMFEAGSKVLSNLPFGLGGDRNETVDTEQIRYVSDYIDTATRNPFGEVTTPDTSTGETRTMSAEESAEARLQRHKTENQPQQVSVYNATTEEMQKIGLDQVTQLVAIKEGINKLVGLLTVRGGGQVGSDNRTNPGNTLTRYTGNHSTLEWGEAPFSSANDPQMQSVVSQVGVA